MAVCIASNSKHAYSEWADSFIRPLLQHIEDQSEDMVKQTGCRSIFVSFSVVHDKGRHAEVQELQSAGGLILKTKADNKQLEFLWRHGKPGEDVFPLSRNQNVTNEMLHFRFNISPDHFKFR